MSKRVAESDTVKITRLQVQMENVTSEIAEIKSLVKETLVKIDNFTVLQADMAVMKDQIKAQQREIEVLQKKDFRDKILFPTLSAAAGAVLTILIINYLSHHAHR